MAKAKKIEFKLDVTSEIIYWDGHSESGPSTNISGESDNEDGVKFITSQMDMAIKKIEYEGGFLEKFGNEFAQMLVPRDSIKSEIKKQIKYQGSAQATAYYEDGTSKTITRKIEKTKYP